MTLARLLEELSKYGKVQLGQYGTGHTKWHCSLDLFVSGKGVSMKVASGFNHESPMDAAIECSSLLVAALNEMKEQSSKVTLPTISTAQGEL